MLLGGALALSVAVSAFTSYSAHGALRAQSLADVEHNGDDWAAGVGDSFPTHPTCGEGDSCCMGGVEHCLYLHDNYAREVEARAAPIGKPTGGRGVILILGQNVNSDPTYGRDSVSGLITTLK